MNLNHLNYNVVLFILSAPPKSVFLASACRGGFKRFFGSG